MDEPTPGDPHPAGSPSPRTLHLSMQNHPVEIASSISASAGLRSARSLAAWPERVRRTSLTIPGPSACSYVIRLSSVTI